MGLADAWNHKTTTGGSATHLPDQSSVRMSTDATAGASIIRQSQRYMRYQPGKSQLIFVTFDFEAVDGGTKRVGYFDSDDGIFFEMNAAGSLSWTVRSSASGSAVDTNTAAQSNWNIDKFDGTGVSGITLDATKCQIGVIDLQWLALGRVRVGYDIDGMLFYAHEFTWANKNNGVYMKTANLPIRYELTGNANATQMQAICASVNSEGGFIADLGHEHVTPNGIAGVSCPVTVETFIMAIRPKTLFNSIPNRGEYVPEGMSFYVTGNAALLRLYHGGTLSGGTWASSDVESGIEYNVGATVSTPGHIVNSDFAAAASGGKAFSSAGRGDASNRIFLSLDIDGNQPDHSNFYLVGTGIGGTATVYANLHWTEIK